MLIQYGKNVITMSIIIFWCHQIFDVIIIKHFYISSIKSSLLGSWMGGDSVLDHTRVSVARPITDNILCHLVYSPFTICSFTFGAEFGLFFPALESDSLPLGRTPFLAGGLDLGVPPPDLRDSLCSLGADDTCSPPFLPFALVSVDDWADSSGFIVCVLGGPDGSLLLALR